MDSSLYQGVMMARVGRTFPAPCKEGRPVAKKINYTFEKRAKEAAKNKKKEEKKLRKLNKGPEESEDNPEQPSDAQPPVE